MNIIKRINLKEITLIFFKKNKTTTKSKQHTKESEGN